jgi:GNAT superfamily N-acetyltransferase
MLDETDSIIRLTKVNIKTAAVTLARAFQDYPVSVFFTPDDEKRRKTGPSKFRRILRSTIATGEAYATFPKMEGVALWFPADIKRNSWWQRLTSGELLSALFTDKETKRRQRAFGEYSMKTRKKIVPGKHWYLQILGVDPDYQGKHYASRLLKPMLARADREGVPCFLETQLEKNVTLYQHFGFRVAEEGTIPGSNVYSWAMVRDEK